MFKKNLNASKPSEHPPQVEECLKVYQVVFVQTAFIPYYLQHRLIKTPVCVLCTSSSTAAVASLSLPLSLSVFLQGYLTQQYRHFPLYLSFYFFAATTKWLVVQTAFIPYFPSGTYYFSICDHGPDSWPAVIFDNLTFFPPTGGCSVGLGAFRFFFK